MFKTKSTKRALLLSALSILMCVSMLVGSTFAWFTDSVTSAGNIIKSGTLDVEMYWAKGTEDPNADATAWTDASTGAIFNNDKWEPGYTEVRHIKIANEGTLALKYQLNIIANGEVSKLADVIDVYYVDPAVQVADRTELTDANKLGTLTEVLANISTTASGNLNATEKHTITLALKMQETAGNEYQGLSIGSSFSVQLLATQLTAEIDSFDDQYDIDAEFEAEIKTAEELETALKAGGKVKLMADITLDNGKNFVVPEGVVAALDLNGHTLNGGFQAGSTTKHVYTIDNNGTLTLKNGTINGRGVANHGSLKIESGTYNAIDTNGGGAVWNYSGSELLINGGTFVAADATSAPAATCINVASGSTAVINGGTFEAKANQTYAIISSGTLTINDAKVSADHGVISNTNLLTINGGEFTQNGNLTQTSSLIYSTSGKVVINDGKFVFNKDGKLDSGLMLYCAGGNLEVNGGDFGGNIITEVVSSWGGTGSAQIKGGTFCKEPGFIAEDYKAVENANGTYSVVLAYTTVKNADELANALDDVADGDVIKLSNDLDLADTLDYDTDANVTLDLGGHSVVGNADTLLNVTSGNVTIQNGTIKNGNVQTRSNGTDTLVSVRVAGDAVATIKDVSIETIGIGILVEDNAKVTELNATVKSYVNANGSFTADAICLNGNARIDLISGGEYVATYTDDFIDAYSGSFSGNAFYPISVRSEGASIGEIRGGTFLGRADDGKNGATIFVNAGKIEKISGGYFGYCKYTMRNNPYFLITVNTANGASIGAITGGTFEYANGFGCDFANIVDASGSKIEVRDEKATVTVKFSSSVKTKEVAIWDVVAK